MKKLFSSQIFKRIALYVYDALTIFGAMCLALLLVRNENWSVTWDYFKTLGIYGVVLLLTTIVVYQICGLYDSVWKYAGMDEAFRILIANVFVLILNLTLIFGSQMFTERIMPVSWAIAFALLAVIFAFIPRFAYRFLKNLKTNGVVASREISGAKERAMIIGAGDSGMVLVDEMQRNDKLDMYPVCVIDDNKGKIGKRINNVKVVGKTDEIVHYAELLDIDTIYVAIPSANQKEIARILNICKDTKCKVKVVPGIGQLVGGQVTLGQTRDVDVVDLLGREEVKVNLDEILGYIEGKVVMVTGGGGSIGSEICRQIANHNPKLLIILDIYENNAYDIEQELKMNKPNVRILALIASVRGRDRMESIFKKYRPQVVFHAAAHKHVPLMETSPNEAIKNNVFGTLNCVKMSDKYHVEKFVLISTDKAVNPTNIMGASKRICEMIIQTYGKRSKTDFVAVRFGNVLGSNGSVIPLFKKQIAKGGPVTVTHENIIRYFMTIPEAVSLVLQAGAYAHSGEIFVLDMGEPVRIYDLAVNLIKLSGHEPNVDIPIKITGLRPGEKMYEEMLMAEEGLQDTANKRIHIGKPIEMDEESLDAKLHELYDAAYAETDDMKRLVSELVTTYKYEK